MIGSVPAPPGYKAEFFGQFVNTFPTPLDRLKHARTLADGAEPHSYRTRSVLSVLWRDDIQDIRVRAHELYDLKNTADYHIGQTVLNFVGCSPQDLKSLRTDSPRAIYFEKFTMARIEDEAVLSHAFGQPSAEFYEKDAALAEAQAINVRSCLGAERLQRIIFDPQSGLEIIPAYDFPTEAPVMATTTCLEFDARLYEQTKEVDDSTLIFGNARAYKILGLLAKYAGRVSETAFLEMRNTGAVSPEVPLPDLQNLVA